MATPTRLTKAGAILLAKALAGNTLTFSRGAFGDAAGHSAPTEREIDNLTSLLHEVMSLRIGNYRVQNDQLIITLVVSNEGLATSFRIEEGGLFALDPESGREVLYAYFYDGADGDNMPAGNSAMEIEYNYEVVTLISNAPNVVCLIDKSTIGIMRDEFEEHINSARDEFEEHINSAEPHPNWDVITQSGNGLWKDGSTLVLEVADTDKLGGIKVGKNLYMEGDSLNAAASEIDVESRIKQLEINQANLYILLQQYYNLGPQSNLQAVENYAPVSSTDTYSARVYSTASKNYLRVFEPSTLRVGGHFTVTDGLLYQEQTHIDSFAMRGDYDTPYIAHLESTLSRDYKGTNYLYRSTVTIKDNKAYGAGEIHTVKNIASITWKGEGEADAQTLTFNAYASLESSFELDGDWSLTADGYFTLD